jgi:dynactin 1
VRELKLLPPLREVPKAPPTPPPESELRKKASPDLDNSDYDENDYERKKPSQKSLTLESRLLYKEYIDFASSARVVDLSAIPQKKTAGGQGVTESDSKNSKPSRTWMRRKDMPSHQIELRKAKQELLSRRVKELLDRAISAGVLEQSLR